ncbi:hypothetical protein ACFOZ2_16585, partial [Citricoccus nitrophenolicus]
DTRLSSSNTGWIPWNDCTYEVSFRLGVNLASTPPFSPVRRTFGCSHTHAKADPLGGSGLSSNLRRFRSVGYDPKSLSALQANAEEHIKAIHERHGWDLPLSTNPRLQPLD